MKVHTKKKLSQQMRKEQAKAGRINMPNGTYQPRELAADNSMKRDFYPQSE